MSTIERRPNIAGLVVSVALIAGGLVWVATRSSSGDEAVASTTSRAPYSTTEPATALPSTTAAPATVVDLELPSAAGVVLFAHTADPNAVVRIEVDRARVVATPVGPVLSTAPTFLAVGPSAAVVRPYDNVRGYMVADTGVVSDPPGLLDDATSMTCSDGSRDRVWLAQGALVQVDFAGSLKARVSGDTVPPHVLGCDGAGEILYRRGGDTLVTGDGPPAVVTSSTLVAAGPRTFLVNDCAAASACSLTVIDRATGERRQITVGFTVAIPQSPAISTNERIGSISPDGRTAVLFRAEREVIFVDMASGTGQGITAIAGDFQSFVWSSDSRYLFYIGGGYRLFAFDRETRKLKPLGVNNVFALAGRPG